MDSTPSDYIDSQNPATVISIVPEFKPLSSTVSERLYFTPPQSRCKYNRVSISTNLADHLLRSTGKTLNEIIGEAGKGGKPKIFTLKTSAEIHGNVTYHKTGVSNIIGIIEGSDLKDEYIVLSAHHDHVGIIGEETYNGADDNASGVSVVLETARLIAKAKREGYILRRSVAVLFPAAEESGLIGSTYYVNNPVFPLTATRACINVDMVGRIDDKYKSTNGNYIYIVNSEQTNGNLLELVDQSNLDSLVINTKDLNSLFSRSDHYNFAKHNIPAVLLTSGLHNDYHTPRDTAELINFCALWKRSRLIFSLVCSLVNN
jgi:Zn-dependent M28 family amino/carboxypeptidase